MRKYFFLFIAVLIFSFVSKAETIKIGLERFINTSQAIIHCNHGYYIAYDGNEELFRFHPLEHIAVVYSNGKLIVSFKGKKYNTQYFLLKIDAQNSEFSVQSLAPKLKRRTYQDNLILKPVGGKIRFVNEVNLDKYVAGVVQAEAGSGWSQEFYKVQAVISRTYALANMRRHETKGYHLCDKVHCQVYHDKTENPDIIEAAYHTQGYVLTDADINLITTAFHSNCGGETSNSEDVWTQPLSYLVSVKDPFCLDMTNATWEKSISKASWKTYLDKNNVEYSDLFSESESFGWQPQSKQKFFMNSRLKTKVIRKDWKLKSSFFTVTDQGDKVLLIGHGYGHGVGLCQQGAMNMSDLGYKYEEILQFYYQGVHLIDLKYLEFFRD